MTILQNYLQKINQIPRLRNCRDFLNFLNPGLEDAAEQVNARDESFAKAVEEKTQLVHAYTCPEVTTISM